MVINPSLYPNISVYKSVRWFWPFSTLFNFMFSLNRIVQVNQLRLNQRKKRKKELNRRYFSLRLLDIHALPCTWDCELLLGACLSC